MVKSKSAVLRGYHSPFLIEELEWDEPQDNEIAVRIVACGVCHSDYHCIDGGYPIDYENYAMLAGHEGVAIVEKCGKNVTRVQEGDHIVMSWMASCGHCEWCVRGLGQLCDRGSRLMDGARDDGTYRVRDKNGRDLWQLSFLGGFSDYAVIPEDCVIKIDKDLPMEKMPIVGCRIPTGWGAVVNTAGARQGCTGLVVGLGGVGISAIQGLKSVGAKIIIAADCVDKEKWAREFGATHFINTSKQDLVEEVYKITGIGVDYAFECIGLGHLQTQCVQSIHKGGHVVFAGVASIEQKGIEVDLNKLTLYQQHIHGTCYGGRSPFEMVPQLVGMYQAGKIKFDEMITKEYRLDQINEAYEDMLAGRNICGVIRF